MTGQLCLSDLFAPFRNRFPIDDLVAAFPDRTGGVSGGACSSLNFGFSTGDDPRAVRENRRRLAVAAAGPIESWVVPRQDHGARVLTVDRNLAGEGALAPSKSLIGADAAIAVDGGVFILALTADCPLVVVADPGQRLVGVAHSGWRGTAAEVVGELLAAFEASGSQPEDRLAALAPAICGDCYEVGDEVRQALQHAPGAREALRGSGVDLPTMVVAALEEGGIDRNRTARDARCSHEDPRLFSHRRDGQGTGRGGLLVGWRR